LLTELLLARCAPVLLKLSALKELPVPFEIPKRAQKKICIFIHLFESEFKPKTQKMQNAKNAKHAKHAKNAKHVKQAKHAKHTKTCKTCKTCKTLIFVNSVGGTFAKFCVPSIIVAEHEYIADRYGYDKNNIYKQIVKNTSRKNCKNCKKCKVFKFANMSKIAKTASKSDVFV
jgi:hypothetical protein